MRRPLVVSLVISVLVAVVAFAATLGAGWSPKLGLDLAGGSEVIYQPSSTVGHRVGSGDINETISILRNRVDAAGVGGASISSQGGRIVVQLPNVKNPKQVLALIGRTAQMQIRPVLCFAPDYQKPTSGKAPGPNQVPSGCSSSTYQLTAANLNVNTSTGQPTNNVQPDPALAAYQTTSSAYNDAHPNQNVLVPPVSGSGVTGRYLLGPTGVPGTAVASATAGIPANSTSWVVDVSLKGQGATQWDNLARQQFHAYVAMDLDGVVQSAPLTLPNQATFSSFAGHVEISGSFTQTQAENLALVLNYGALPVRLTPVNTLQVSPSLGKSSLKAGLAAGLGGLILVLLYTILYYRALGVVVVTGLLLTGGLLWAIVSLLGRSSLGLTLDLSGVTGLIVSVGITVDSYIVYFERLKDEARAGRSIRTSVDRSFRGAFRTVLAADLVSLAAAVVLYLLSVGTVRGFAFFLGLSTILDIATTFFFTRPLVIILGRSRTVTDARFIGIARGLAVDQGVAS